TSPALFRGGFAADRWCELATDIRRGCWRGLLGGLGGLLNKLPSCTSAVRWARDRETSPRIVMAQSGHHDHGETCPLLGAKRTLVMALQSPLMTQSGHGSPNLL